jgi:hypothetical protein
MLFRLKIKNIFYLIFLLFYSILFIGNYPEYIEKKGFDYMEKTNKKNNKLIQKNTDEFQVDPVPKKRGRPKGTKNKTVAKRPDKTVQTEQGENTKYLLHDTKLAALPDIDINNPLQVKNRIEEYFNICAFDDIKPSVASLALSFHVSRFVLFDYVNGRNQAIKNIESLHTLKSAYDRINSYYEHMMNNGRINPVAGIFLMKNNMGYKDNTEYTINTNTENQDTITDISNRAGLLQD